MPGQKRHRKNRAQARRMLKVSSVSNCYLKHTKQCKGPIEVHHIDEDPTNNTSKNLVALCQCHHRLIHSGKITFANPVAKFKISPDGKRRYF